MCKIAHHHRSDQSVQRVLRCCQPPLLSSLPLRNQILRQKEVLSLQFSGRYKPQALLSKITERTVFGASLAEQEVDRQIAQGGLSALLSNLVLLHNRVPHQKNGRQMMMMMMIF